MAFTPKANNDGKIPGFTWINKKNTFKQTKFIRQSEIN